MNLTHHVLAPLALALALTAGCNSDSGPQRFHLSGEVTFAGEPIPAGDVLFTPDGAKGNSGPQGIATIRDGKYDTRAEGGKGIGGGATVVRVTGLGGPSGTKLLCEYEYRVDLPKEDSTHKVEVPASAANKKPATPEI